MIEQHVRKVIIIDQPFLDDLRNTSLTDLQAFTSPDIDTMVITLPLSSHSQINELARYVDPTEIRAGSILVKPVYTDQFVPVDSFTEDIVLRKYGLFVQLCIALGAKKVAISSIEDINLESSESVSAEANIGGSAPVGKAEVAAKAKQSSLNDEVRQSIMKLHTEAHGGEPNLEEADRIMDQFGLRKDALFTDVYNMCRVSTNRLSRHEVSLDFSKEVKRVFDSSMQAKIKVMSKLYQGCAEFDKARKSLEKNRSATRLSVVVEF